MDKDPAETKSVNTGGGAYIDGSVNLQRGDFVNGNQVNNYQVEIHLDINLEAAKELDMDKVLATVRQALPASDQTPRQLASVLDDFKKLHALLNALKDLHDGLNDLFLALDPFKLAVERTYTTRRRPDLNEFMFNWRFTHARLVLLLNLAEQPNSTYGQPFQITVGGAEGPPWAVELYAGGQQISALLTQNRLEMAEFHDAVSDFGNVVQRHQYLVDKELREATDQLLQLSEMMLTNMSQDNPPESPPAAGPVT